MADPEKNVVARVVLFDFGQTLGFFSADFLAARLAGRGVAVDADAVRAAYPDARRASEAALAQGLSAETAWRRMLELLLARGGVAENERWAAWLWSEQPRHNLWREVPDEARVLLAELRAAGRRLAIVSNSEGRLAELVSEVGLASWFEVIADSGVLGIDKPDPGIFRWTLDRLGSSPEEAVHVGDSLAADVAGARAAGVRPIWFDRDGSPGDPEAAESNSGLERVRSYAELRRALLG